MKTVQFTTPDGRKGKIEAPDEWSDQQISQEIDSSLKLGTGGQSLKRFPSERTRPPTSLNENVMGAVYEPVAQMLTGAIAKPISDVAGLATLGKQLVSPGTTDPMSVKQRIQGALTYEPRTPAGKAVSEYNPLALLGKGLAWGAGKVRGMIEPPPSAAGTGAEVRRGLARGAEEAIEQAPGIIGMKTTKGAGTTVRPDISKLAKEGVSMTPGQIAGGTVQRLEDAATSWPLLGDAIKGAQRRGIESFNAAAYNRALTPIGQKLPKGLSGNQAVQYTYGKLGEAYDTLLPQLKGDLNKANATTGQTMLAELNNLKQMAQQGLSAEHAKQLTNIIDKEVIGRFTKPGLATGETLQQINEHLRLTEQEFKTGGPFDRQLSGAINEVREAMDRMIDDVNPAHAKELTKVRRGYANFKRAQAAAGYIGTKEGTFTPSQLERAVRAGDKSKDKARYAEGRAPMQDLSGAGKRVLSQTVPDSGTPFRAATMWIAEHPLRATVLGIPAALLSAAYTPAGQAAIQSFLLNRPSIRNMIASEAGKAGMYGIGAEAQQIPPPPSGQ